MKKCWGVLAIAALAVLIPFEAADAASILFRVPDDASPAPGENSLAFFGNPGDGLLGLDIIVDAVVGSGTPLLDGVAIPCIDCRLNFVTGPFLGGGTDGWFFTGGGGVFLTGSLDLGVAVELTPFAFAGFFTGAPIILDGFPGPGLIQGFTLATILDVKNPILTGLFGLPSTLYEGTIFLNIAGFGDAPGPLLAQVQNGFVINSPVPEPGMLSLFFGGLLWLASAARRK